MNITWLAKITSALSVGVVGGIKVVPQWGAASLYYVEAFPETRIIAGTLNLSGALLCAPAARPLTSSSTLPPTPPRHVIASPPPPLITRFVPISYAEKRRRARPEPPPPLPSIWQVDLLGGARRQGAGATGRIRPRLR